MNNKKVLIPILVILLIAVVSISTFAIYKSSSTGNVTLETANWKIKLNGQDITSNNTFTYNLKDADWTHDAVIDSNEQNLVVIAPGSYGTFNLTIDATEAEVDVEYKITAVVKRNNEVVDLSSVNNNLSIGYYDNDTLVNSNIAVGEMDAMTTHSLELRVMWNEVDSTTSNTQDININDEDFTIEVTVITKQNLHVAVYPEGKNKETVQTGDIVKIGTEEFYVVKHDGNDLILLSHYNLNVGNSKKESAPEGIQDSEVRGMVSALHNDPEYGMVPFANTNYWDGKIGTKYPGEYCTEYTQDKTCAYVYDNNSNLYQYVENYKAYLESLGATIKEARLLKLEEIVELGCEDTYCENVPNWVKETSYWLGTSSGSYYIWRVRCNSTVYHNTSYEDFNRHGVRPVIVI